jgi:UDP-2,4-diacetamido-2,4,6-trideoxy-beta-L-altropyranose hydrolase
MNIAFRVDASSQIGTGHLMRCMALADALKRCGAVTRFVSRHMPDHLRNMLITQGHEFVLIDRSPHEAISSDLGHAHWLGTSQQADAQDTIQALSDSTWDWLVVDHYALDVRWETSLRQKTKNILVIDDIADRNHDCNVLLDQNLYADMSSRYDGRVPTHCQLLLGPRYALLRDEFRKLHEQAKPRTGQIRRILVFFGGVDAENYTGRAIEALVKIDIPELHVDVVIGSQHPHRAQIQGKCTQYGFVCHVQTSQMAELMAAADLAIGAGGSSNWERCCLGLPSLLTAIAENQVLANSALAEFGAVDYLGKSSKVSVDKWRRALTSRLHSDWLTLTSSRALGLVDGLGIQRLMDTMKIT